MKNNLIKITVRVDEKSHAQAGIISKRNGESIADFYRRAIENEIRAWTREDVIVKSSLRAFFFLLSLEISCRIFQEQRKKKIQGSASLERLAI